MLVVVRLVGCSLVLCVVWCLLAVGGCALRVVCCVLCDVRCMLFVDSCCLNIVVGVDRCYFFVVCWRLLVFVVVCYSLFVACCSVLVVRRVLFVV